MSERQVRLLLCEYSEVHHVGLIEGFRKALALAGYRASTEIAENIDNALKLLGNGEFEILVTDLSFGRDLAVGLDFVRKAKIMYPHLCVIACSSSSPSVEMVRNKRPSFDMFIPKRVILNPRPEEPKSIGREIHAALGRLVGVRVQIQGGSDRNLSVSGERISEWELTSLISQVLADLNSTEEPFRPVEATFTRIAGGYSGSLVGSLTLSATAGLTFVKTIVKISLAKWARDEAFNFKRYAKWMLPFNKRVELVGEGKTDRFGAVAYAFVFGGEQEFFNLTKVINDRDPKALSEYLEVVFDYDLVNFYNRTRLNSDVNIGQHYRMRYFPDERVEETTAAFRDIVQRYFGGREEAASWRIGSEIYPDPFRAILSGSTKKFTLSICHGDLNSDNIICTPDRRVAYIDFQDTGPGHLLQDFAALESSIRLNWGIERDKPSVKHCSSLLKREWAISTRAVRASAPPQYDGPCLALRELAANKFPATEPWEYPYAIGALSLKLMRVKGFSEAQLCRLAACALVATRQYEAIKSHGSGVA